MTQEFSNQAEVEHVTQYMFDLVRSAYANPVDSLHPTWHPASGVLSGFNSKAHFPGEDFAEMSDTEINAFLCAADLDQRVDAGLFATPPADAPDEWPLDRPELTVVGDDWFANENSEVL